MDKYVNPVIRSWIVESRFVFIYGSAGVGKSHLARSFSNLANNMGKRSCIIATEEGTLALLRSYPLNSKLSEVLFVTDKYSLLYSFLECLFDKKYIIIDTINSFFDGSDESLKIIGLISALSRFSSGGVLALGQVREVDNRLYPAAWQAIIPWAEVIGKIERNGEKNLVYLEKPRKGILAFKIEKGDVIWI